MANEKYGLLQDIDALNAIAQSLAVKQEIMEETVEAGEPTIAELTEEPQPAPTSPPPPQTAAQAGEPTVAELTEEPQPTLTSPPPQTAAQAAGPPAPWRQAVKQELPRPDATTQRALRELIQAFRTLLSLELPCVTSVLPANLFSAALAGSLNLAMQYGELLKHAACESGISDVQLGALGVALSVPKLDFIGYYTLESYVDWVSWPRAHDEDGVRVLTSAERKHCILSSELHIGLSAPPSEDSALQVLRSMPVWFLVRSWQQHRLGLDAHPAEPAFLGFRGREAIKLLQRIPVEVDELIYARHRVCVSELLARNDVAIGADDWDAVLEQRLLLEAGRLNVERFKELEGQIALSEDRPSSVRLLFAMGKQTANYPEYHRELQAVRRECRALRLFTGSGGGCESEVETGRGQYSFHPHPYRR